MTHDCPRPWLIIGAGLHGLHIAHALVQQAAVPPASITLLDPHPSPAQQWRQRSQRCGMAYLRSPAAHNLDISAHSLLRFPRRPGSKNFQGPYRRPELGLFNRHVRQTAEASIRACAYVQGRALALTRPSSHYEIDVLDAEGEQLRLAARRVVLALGPPEPRIPAWARNQTGVAHLYESNFSDDMDSTASRPAVVGTGLSGIQKALQLGRKGKPVMLAGPLPEISEFDSDPCFLGPRCLDGFRQLESPATRRRVLNNVRAPGSVPTAMFDAFTEAARAERIQHFNARVTSLRGNRLVLEDGTLLTSDHVVLATGFEQGIPGAQWLQPAIEQMRFPVDAIGTPVVDEHLQWQEGLFVSGRLAELEIGPAAANIAGARLAARRIVRAASTQSRPAAS